MRLQKQGLLVALAACIFGSANFIEDSEAARSTKKVKANALNSVCKSIRELRSGEIYKHIASSHISPADPRRFSTSFITVRGVGAPTLSCLEMYDSNGKAIHRIGRYFPTGSSYSSRFYGGAGCGTGESPSILSSRSKRKAVYLKVTPKTCVRIPSVTRCFNSSAC